MKKVFSLVVVFAVLLTSSVFGEDLVNHLQDISVTVMVESPFQKGSGSGVIITRGVKPTATSNETVKTNFVLTAGHVVDILRTVRTVVEDGKEKKIVEFDTMSIVKDLVENGRKVGETRMQGRVLKYSDSETGEDLALCMLHKTNFINTSTKFYLEDDKIVKIGTPLFHVGSLLGQGGSNSMTTGIMSQVGRVIPLGNSGGVIFDQTTVTAFPGSSGGGVFIAEGDHAGKYCGMLVRGAGETFNLIVPARRLHSWAVKNNLEWVLDESKPIPTLEELNKITVE